MNKYIIKWNSGYSDKCDVVEAVDISEAMSTAYDAWREDAESKARIGVYEYSKEKAEELGAE